LPHVHLGNEVLMIPIETDIAGDRNLRLARWFAPC
jgi:hypothetical protein